MPGKLFITKKINLCATIVLIFLLLIGCAQKETAKENSNELTEEGVTMGKLRITSSAFKDNGDIPDKYTCNGENINPPLSIDGVPDRAKSLVIIIDDPDAPVGVWDHWVMWNIAVESAALKIEESSVPKGAVQGMNSWKKKEYGGPCPPSGTHRYIFKLYALDAALDLDSNSDKGAVEKAIKEHILAQAKLTGVYSKK